MKIIVDIPNFTEEELKCPCCGDLKINNEFLFRIQLIRTNLEFPLKVTSFYRCSKHNLAVGGKVNSDHLTGSAIDIVYSDDHQLYLITKNAIAFGINKIGVGPNFIHLGYNKDLISVLWTY